MSLHETHVCRDCGAEITVPYARPQTGTIQVPVGVVASAVEDLARAVAAFVEDAQPGPWRPLDDGPDEEGQLRRRDSIWLTNDSGDQLQIDEHTAEMLVEAVRLTQLGRAAGAE